MVDFLKLWAKMKIWPKSLRALRSEIIKRARWRKKKIKKQLDLKNQGRRNQKSAPIAESKNLSENIDLLAFWWVGLILKSYLDQVTEHFWRSDRFLFSTEIKINFKILPLFINFAGRTFWYQEAFLKTRSDADF